MTRGYMGSTPDGGIDDADRSSSTATSNAESVRDAMLNLLARIEEIPPKANGYRLHDAYDVLLKAVSDLLSPSSAERYAALEEADRRIGELRLKYKASPNETLEEWIGRLARSTVEASGETPIFDAAKKYAHQHFPSWSDRYEYLMGEFKRLERSRALPSSIAASAPTDELLGRMVNVWFEYPPDHEPIPQRDDATKDFLVRMRAVYEEVMKSPQSANARVETTFWNQTVSATPEELLRDLIKFVGVKNINVQPTQVLCEEFLRRSDRSIDQK